MSSHDVTVQRLVKRAPRTGEKQRPRPWRLRWTVAGKRFERRYATEALADHERSKLLRAMAKGEAFDETTGRPDSEVRADAVRPVTWYEHAQAYVDMKWTDLAAKSRKSMVEGLVTVTIELANANDCRDQTVLRNAVAWALNPNRRRSDPTAETRSALAWIEQNSLPISRLTDLDITRRVLNACARKLDGTPAAATTTQRKRAVFYNSLGYAIERGLLDYNPIDRVQWKAPEVAEQVDRRVVASTAQVEAILRAVPKVHGRAGQYVAFFGCLYYAGLRPSEAANLRCDDITLPRKGWGRITLVETAPLAGSDWTDDGDVREVRGLKHRARGHTRSVPIPPDLVKLLRTHVREYGVSDDGHLFRNGRGNPISYDGYGTVWRRARAAALTPHQVRSPLAGRPYDLRHAAVTLWLNGGVPVPEVARRAGHGVAVLLKVYAGCIDGEEDLINARIDKALEASRQQNSGAKRGPST